MNKARERGGLMGLLGAVGEGQIVSLVGAGGKTALLFALARLLLATGERVVCTTSTKIFPPTAAQCPHLLVSEDTEEALVAQVRACLEKAPFLTLVAARAEGKCLGLAPDSISRLATALPDVRFLVEADGAAQRALKAPAAHEPVVPATTSCCIGMIGLDCLGKTLDATTVHRLERVLAVTGQASGSRITLGTLTRLVAHPEGMFRACPACRRVVFCNKAEELRHLHALAPLSLVASAGDVDWFVGSVHAGWCQAVRDLPY